MSVAAIVPHGGIKSLRASLPSVIEFSRAAYDEIVSHALEGGDREVCGILAGEYDADRSVVTAVDRAANAAPTPETRYAIDPEEQLEIIERLEDAGLEIVGFYHSHPDGPTRPSETDVERATWDDYSYVIVALDGHPFVGSWRWRGDDAAFEQEPVCVVDTAVTAD